MRLYSYILRNDSGFAPNPFGRFCTLACCKPAIRRTACPGDLVLGLTPKHLGYRLSYAMYVKEVMPFASYWNDPRFKGKRPDRSCAFRSNRMGDNCYEPIGPDEFRQHPCAHSNKDGSEDLGKKEWDLRGKKVLVGGRYWYFGKESLDLPPQFEFLEVGRGHRTQFSEDQIKAIVGFLDQVPVGVHGAPRGWPDDDGSWANQGQRNTKSCR